MFYEWDLDIGETVTMTSLIGPDTGIVTVVGRRRCGINGERVAYEVRCEDGESLRNVQSFWLRRNEENGRIEE